MHLCLSVTFLDEFYHGRARGEGEPEWPPSPLRLFQALVAGAHHGVRAAEWSAETEAAMEWLAARNEPPVVLAPGAASATSYTLFVPNNDGDKEPDRQQRLTAKVAHPTRLPEHDRTLQYVWALTEDEARDTTVQRHAATIDRVARSLLALGWGIDHAHARAAVLDEAGYEAIRNGKVVWRPHRGAFAATPRRIPTPRTLSDLRVVHRSLLGSVRGKSYQSRARLREFADVAYLRETELPPRPVAVFDLIRVDREGTYASFRPTDAALVAAWTRHVACEAARNDRGQVFPGGSEVYVAGHVGDRSETPPRFSYLPLPTIRNGPTDGLVRRVMIAEPIGGSGRFAEWARRRLEGAVLVDLDSSERARLAKPERVPDGVVRLYVEPSRTWTTVTPVVLPGHDDGKRRKAMRLLRRTIAQAGLAEDQIEDVVLRKAPFWDGARHPRQYCVSGIPTSNSRWHVLLRFKEPITGPLALGAGRHRGLGLFAVPRRGT